MAIPFYQYNYGSAVYFMVAYLASLDHPSIGMPALGLKHVIIFVGCLCAAFFKFSASIPLLESLQSISVISFHLLTSYFGGKSVTHKKYSL